MLQGKDLLLPPFNLTRSELFAFVRSGKLVPYQKHSSLYPDPTEPPGSERIFPRHDQYETYGKLRSARYQRKWIQGWLAKSPEERQAAQVMSPPLDQEYAERLRQYTIEIPEYESKLKPSLVWQGEFSPRQQEELFGALEDAWYLNNDTENLVMAERKPMLVDQILLEPEQRELLCKLIEAVRSLPEGTPRGKFFAATAMGLPGALFVYTEGNIEVTGSLTDAEILAESGLLGVSYGSAGEPTFYLKPAGLQYYRELKTTSLPAEAVEKEIRGHLSSDKFKKVFLKAFEKWSQGESLLWESESEKQFTMIGHLCREAMQEFADALIQMHETARNIQEKTKDISRIAAVLEQMATSLGSKETDFLKQLLKYWATVSELVQRQEHGGVKEGEPLKWEDARRVVFQTMIVMYEIHRSLTG